MLFWIKSHNNLLRYKEFSIMGGFHDDHLVLNFKSLKHFFGYIYLSMAHKDQYSHLCN